MTSRVSQRGRADERGLLVESTGGKLRATAEHRREHLLEVK
jgi:hypothetical protein